MLGLSFSSKLDWNSYIISIAKMASKKIGALSLPMRFLSLLRLLCIFINLPYGLTTVVMPGLVLLQKQICSAVGPSRTVSLEHLAYVEM